MGRRVRKPGGGRIIGDGPTRVRKPGGRVAPDGRLPVIPRLPPGQWVTGPQPPPPQRDITLSDSILDTVPLMVYGTRRVAGRIGARYYDSSAKTLTLGIIFAYGEQNSIATNTTFINGEVITSATGLSNESVHAGDGSTALNAALTAIPGWTAAKTTKWKAYAHAVVKVDCRAGQAPGSFLFESVLGGRLVDASWRTGGSSGTATVNPAEIVYDIRTSAQWSGLAASKVDTTTLEAFANWCDEVMSDATVRYQWNGALDIRDPEAAIATVMSLGSAPISLGYQFVNNDGTLGTWAEMAPAPSTGAWSASASATITEDSTAGAATSELAVDEYIYIGTNLRKITAVTDDDTVVLDSAVTVTAAKIRRLSQVYIEKKDWVVLPGAIEDSKLRAPDKYKIRFGDGTKRGSHQVTTTYGAGTEKIIETYLQGITSAAVATRVGETTLKVANLQRFRWQGIVWNEIGAKLQPGDVILFDDDVLTLQPARVLHPIEARADGLYVLHLREYDPAAYSESTATTDSVPSAATSWASGDPPILTKIKTVYSGTEYDLIAVDGSGRSVLGNTSQPTWLSGTKQVIPNDVPVYMLKGDGITEVQALKCDTNDRMVLGDGSEAVYLNSSGQIILPTDGSFKHDWTVKDTFLAWNKTASTYDFGNTSYDMTIKGNSITFTGYRYHATAWPTTSNIAADEWCLWVKGSAPDGIRLYVNVGGVLWWVSLANA